MYFNGKLAIDPAQITKIQNLKPTKMFGKLFYYLSAGTLSDKEEHETFTAVAILQQLNTVLRSMGINNIVRLAQDDVDFYLDEEGRHDDLQEAMDEFQIQVDPILSEVFNNLYLVLEHHDTELKYLIEIRIKRKHKVGEYPIQIEVNGILTDFSRIPGESAEDVKERMRDVFRSQDAYERYVNSKKARFNEFVHALDLAVRKFIQVEDTHLQTDAAIIRPRKSVQQAEDIRHERNPELSPAFHGYYGFGDAFFYAWMWSELSHANHIHIHDVNIVDEAGQTMMEVGQQGFDAGESNALNPDENFEAPGAGDIQYAEGHDYDSDFSTASVGGDSVASEGLDSTSSSWFDSFGFGGGSEFTDGGDSDGSCSSCGGCGGD